MKLNIWSQKLPSMESMLPRAVSHRAWDTRFLGSLASVEVSGTDVPGPVMRPYPRRPHCKLKYQKSDSLNTLTSYMSQISCTVLHRRPLVPHAGSAESWSGCCCPVSRERTRLHVPNLGKEKIQNSECSFCWMCITFDCCKVKKS